ncbi:hypothetical protein [Spirosoma panaciterrae]|uniref:hypothetical protein n=1 Tax=Spirosoma panaciterrae TaxID=496058 RepID=UPI00037FD0C8|nr:hypothetical protein [Spirosoma panaciterrae]
MRNAYTNDSDGCGLILWSIGLVVVLSLIIITINSYPILFFSSLLFAIFYYIYRHDIQYVFLSKEKKIILAKENKEREEREKIRIKKNEIRKSLIEIKKEFKEELSDLYRQRNKILEKY